ncbi:MAG: BtpA/SgcQ family protein [Myxococcota bacterium]|nr:BtpA/SgcQ family protein [Myxococcota bacterium]
MSPIIKAVNTDGTPALIGMIHLEALPGAPNATLHLDEIVRRAAEDARVLADAGFHGIMVENYGDTPFFKSTVPTITVAAMTRCALAIRHSAPDVKLGINVLRNDGLSALNIAHVVGAHFIRVNVLAGAMVTDQGLIEGCGAELMRHRRYLDADIEVWADVGVKHATALGSTNLNHLAQDTSKRGLADALIVSGTATGVPTRTDDIATIRRAVPNCSLVIGSGAQTDTVAGLDADAIIVGTALKVNGRIHPQHARAFADAAGQRR